MASHTTVSVLSASTSTRSLGSLPGDEPYSRLSLGVPEIRLDRPLRNPYIKLRIGPEFYVDKSLRAIARLHPINASIDREPVDADDKAKLDLTSANESPSSSRAEDDNAAEPGTVYSSSCKFAFHISFHSQLFDYLHVDVYERYWLWPDELIGRAVLRLSTLSGMPRQFTSWFELHHPRRVADTLLLAPGPIDLTTTNRGGVALSIRYVYQDIHHLGLTGWTWSGGPREGSPSLLTAPASLSVPSPAASPARSPTATPSPPLSLTESEVLEAGEAADEPVAVPRQLRYFTCLSLLGPFLRDDLRSAALDSQRVFAAFAQGLDMTRTTFTLALMLLSRFYRRVPIVTTRDYLKDRELLVRVRRAFTFCMATFGWQGIDYAGLGRGYLVDVFRAEADRKSILEFLRLPPEHLLALSLRHDDLFRPSYLILYDADTHTIVLGVRGSMSVTDGVTDLNCHYRPWRTGLVHAGMAVAASWMVHHVMPRVIAAAEAHGTDRILLTGHSLGASVSALMVMQMLSDAQDNEQPHRETDIKEHTETSRDRSPDTSAVEEDTASSGPFRLAPRFAAHIQAICFGCPPVVSLGLVPLAKDRILMFNYGHDIVPHLSYGSIMDFRLMLLTAAKHVRAGDVFGSNDARFGAACHALTRCREMLRQAAPHPKLYVPGTFFHMHSADPDEQDKPARRRWTVVERSDARFHAELMIKPKMLHHHMPKKYLKSLDRAIETLDRLAVSQERARTDQDPNNSNELDRGGDSGSGPSAAFVPDTKTAPNSLASPSILTGSSTHTLNDLAPVVTEADERAAILNGPTVS